MPKPRYKSFIITNNGKVLRAFYAGRNAKGMKEDAAAQFFRVFGQGVMDGGASPDADIKEKFYSDNPWAFNADVENQRLEGSVVEYTPKLEGIGERWLAYPKPVEETNLDPVFGNNSGESVPPSLDPFDNFVEEIVGDAQTVNAGAAAAPVPDPQPFETPTPTTIPAPTEQEEGIEEPSTEVQSHEIVNGNVRITFDTEGPPEWNGQDIPEGYRRIDQDVPVEVNNINPGKLNGEPEDVVEADAAMYSKKDIVLHDGQYSKGDKRYFTEDQDLPVEGFNQSPIDRMVPTEEVFNPKFVGWSQGSDEEYEKIPTEPPTNAAKVTPKPFVDYEVRAEMSLVEKEDNEKEESVDQDKIDTGKLRNPANWNTELDELRQNPATEVDPESKKRAGHLRVHVSEEIPKSGRRSHAPFGVY